MTSKLEIEVRYYAEIKPQLLPEAEGKYALIKERELIGTFDTLDEAYEKGMETYGNIPFLIKGIRRDEHVGFIPLLSVGYENKGE